MKEEIEHIVKSVLQSYIAERHNGSLRFKIAEINLNKFIFLPIDKRGDICCVTPYVGVTHKAIEIIASKFNKNIAPRGEYTLYANFGYLNTKNNQSVCKVKIWNIANTSVLKNFREEFTELYNNAVIPFYEKASSIANMAELIDLHTPIKLHKIFRLPIAYLLANRYEQSISALQELSHDPSVRLNVPQTVIKSFQEYIYDKQRSI